MHEPDTAEIDDECHQDQGEKEDDYVTLCCPRTADRGQVPGPGPIEAPGGLIVIALQGAECVPCIGVLCGWWGAGQEGPLSPYRVQQ